MPNISPARLARRWLAVSVVLTAACADQSPTSARAPEMPGVAAPSGLQAFECQADIAGGTLSCGAPVSAGGASKLLFGGQGTNIQLTSSNLVVAGNTISFDVTVQNLLPEAIGTPDGVVLDTAGVRVFFAVGPTATGGMAWVANADGTGDFMGSGQPYFQYNEILSQNQVSGSKPWQIGFDPGVTNITFSVYISAEIQPLLIINEVMANPANPAAPTVDTDREWFEVYNAGRFPVQMQGMLIADSAGSGRRPYHVIASSVSVPSGGYVVLGSSTSTSANGGATVDYSYGGALALANSLDAVKIARSYGVADTLTIDRTQYANAAISAQPGIARELKNPALDNSNMDGSNWADALVTAVYGDGGRGTPKAQNSAYTP